MMVIKISLKTCSGCSLLFGLCFLLILSEDAFAELPIVVAWNARPPYQYLENGVEKGARLERVKQILSMTQVPFVLVQEPPKRIWNQYAAAVKRYCSFDWYRLPEREALVQFSIPLEKNAGYSVLANVNSYDKVAAHKTLKSLLSDTSLTFGMVDSASYGSELEAMIKDSKNKQERHSVLPMIMARMIGANRASFMLIEKAAWDFLKDSDSYFQQTRIVEIVGIPKGLDSHIVCSKDVSPATMAKINDAIRQLSKQASPTK
jgi:polar amino acid transport system substrate-binding protein